MGTKKIDLTKLGTILVLSVFALLLIFELLTKTVFQISDRHKYILTMALNVVLFLFPALLLLKKSGERGKSFFKLKPVRLKWLPMIVMLSLTASLCGILLNALLLSLGLPDWLAGNGRTAVPGQQNVMLTLVSTVLFPAVFEELFFRGALMSAYAKRSTASAVFGTALLFTFIHASPLNFFGPAIAGVVYAAIILIYESVYATILAHIINNTLYFLAMRYADRLEGLGLNGAFICFVVILFLVMLYFALKSFERRVDKIKKVEKPTLLDDRLIYNRNSPVFNFMFFIAFLMWTVKVAIDVIFV